MQVSIRLLIIEDSMDDAALLLLLLRQGGYGVHSERVDSAAGLAQALNKKWEIIISDHSMPQFSGTEALKMVRARDVDVPFIFVSGTIGEDAAIDAMRTGAQDYVMKTNLKRLVYGCTTGAPGCRRTQGAKTPGAVRTAIAEI